MFLLQPPANLEGRPACLDQQQFGLGLLALAAWLQANGHEARGLHLPLALGGGRRLDDIITEIVEANPLVVAIGLNWVHFSLGALELARRVKLALPACPVVIGGQHASLFAGEIAQLGVADAVIVGEAELPLLALCDAALSGETRFDDVPGVVTARGHLTAPAVIEDLDTLPFYSYRSLRPGPAQSNVGALATSRGACPLRCAYCVEPVIGTVQGRPKHVTHSADWLAEQVVRLVAEGISRLTVQDGFFLSGDRGLVALADALGRRGVRLEHLNLFAHPGTFGRVGLEAVGRIADLVTLDLGVETGAPSVARLAHRTLQPSKVLENVDEAVAAGAIPYTWWLVGLPGEDEVAWRETQDLVVATMAAGAIPRWVSPLILLPGTPMHAASARYGVQPRFHIFEDYARFSDTSITEALHFATVVTHSTNDAGPEEIVGRSRSLRAFMDAHFPLVEAFWGARAGSAPQLGADRARLIASFF